MFYILTPRDMKRRRRRKIYPKRVDGLPCYSLDLPIIKGMPDWNGIVSNEKLLLPIGINTPPQIKSYGSNEWLINISTIIALRQLSIKSQDLVFYDKDGKYIKYFEKIAHKARKCTVFTSNKRIYENSCGSIYKNYGCYIRVNSMLGLKNGVAICDNQKVIKLPNFKYLGDNVSIQNSICVPQSISSKLPIKVKNIDLAEALCIGCNIGKPEDYVKPSFFP